MKRDYRIVEQKTVIENLELAISMLREYAKTDQYLTHEKHMDPYFRDAIDNLDRKYNSERTALKAYEVLNQLSQENNNNEIS